MFSAILQNFGYLSSWQTGSHSGSAASGGLVSRAIILFTFWGFTYFFFAKKIINQKTAILSLWFSATIFGALLSTRPYPHYLIQVLPPFSIVILIILQKNLISISRYLLIFLILCLSLLFVKYKFYVYPVFSYYSNFYSYLMNRKSYINYQIYFNPNISTIYQVADYVKSTTSADENIFVWGDEPYIYALTDRLPVGRFTVAYHRADFDQYDNVIQELKLQFPSHIVYKHQEGRPFEELDQFIEKYYSPATEIGDIIIYNSR
jgi:hypothetical protein